MKLRAILLCAAVGASLAGSDPSIVQITVTEGTNFAAVASPDRKSIAIDLQGGLWILPISGGEARRITPDTFEARQPTWAPDGQSLAVQGYDDNAWHIYTVRRDGTGLTALTEGPFDDREPDWSPDGSRIAFASDRFGGIYTAWTVTVATHAVAQVSKVDARMPCWVSADEVIFEGHTATDAKTTAWWRASAGGREQMIRSSASPNPQLDATTCANGRVHGAAELLPHDEDIFPFLPQIVAREALLYTADGHIKYRRDATTPPGVVPFEAKLKLRRPVYTRSHRDLQPSGPQRAMGIVDPAVSPDGSMVAFTALGDLWLLNLRRSARLPPSPEATADRRSLGGGGQPSDPKPIQLTNDPYLELDPAWSPDGTKLVFSSDRGGNMDLWMMEISDPSAEASRYAALRQLTHENGPATSAAWSPNGTRIAYLLDRRVAKTIDLQRPNDKPATHGAANAQDSGRPTWGRDGRVFTTGELFHYSDRFREGTNQLVLHSVDSERPIGSVTLVANHSAGNRQNSGPVWSPDGSRMAYVSEGQLMVIGVGSNAAPRSVPVALSADSPDSPTWQADSRHIVYLTPDGLRRISVDGGEPEPFPIDLSWTPPAAPGRSVVHAGRLFDGKANALQTSIDIIVEGGRIRDVRPHDAALHTGTVIDASDETVMPGLIEMHAHLDSAYGDALGRLWLAYGITTVRNPAVNPYWGLEMREAYDSGRRIGPRIFNAGDPFDGTRIYYSGGVSIGADAQLERELDRATRLGYDFFKTYVRLPDKYQKRVIEYAHDHGLAVTSHEIYPAAAFGVDGVEHIRGTSRRGYSPKVTARNNSYQDVIEILAKSGMTLTPTIGIGGGFAFETARDPSMMADPRLSLIPALNLDAYRNRFQAHAGTEDLAKQDAALEGYRRTVAAVVAAGGRIIAGTDSPIIPYGLGLHSELLHFVEAGMAPFRALQTATIDAADALGVGADLGSVETGKLADLAFVTGDPLRDVRAARNVRRVMRGGKLYDASALIQR